MSNEIEVKQNQRELTVIYEIDGNQIKLTPSIVQEYIVGTDAEITLPEFKFFTELCKARKLNPFLREAYCIKYGKNPAQIVVGKDAILKRAITNANFNGIESGVIVLTAKGEVVERKGTFKLPTETLVGGWAKVYRKNWEYPTYCSVGFDEVAQKKSDGTLNSNWATKGATMVEKVAKVRALRETFIEDLGGMYEAEETGVEIKESAPDKAIIEQDEPEEQKNTSKPETVSLDDI